MVRATMTDPAPSATVILARDAAHAPEFLMVKRVQGGAFGGAHVFPGGVLEPADSDLVGDEAAARQRLNLADNALAYFSAALRELFEETAILLTDPVPHADARLALRDALLDGQLTWPDLLREHGFDPRLDALRYVSFWVTPPTLSRRFSTRFFFAVSDNDQEAVACNRELLDCEWLSAAETIARADAGELKLHPPTLLTLHELKKHSSLDALNAWASRKEEGGVTCIEPASADPGEVQRAVEALR